MKDVDVPVRPRKRRFLRSAAIAVAVILAAASVALFILSQPRPKGTAGPEAEALAQNLLRSVNTDAWKNTGAVRFTFLGHRHLWDRQRGYEWLESGDRRILLRINARTGRAWEGVSEAHGERAQKLLNDAYAAWVNDSFWLNPVSKIMDRGVTRSLVRDSMGNRRLLVEYASGGLTPGDAYLWTPGADGSPPIAWSLWVHVIPIGGLSTSWERWVTLSTGAKVATLHRIGPVSLELKDVAGAKTLAALLGSTNDPFAALH